MNKHYHHYHHTHLYLFVSLNLQGSIQELELRYKTRTWSNVDLKTNILTALSVDELSGSATGFWSLDLHLQGWMDGSVEGWKETLLEPWRPSNSKNPNTCEEASNTSKTTYLVQMQRGRTAELESVKDVWQQMISIEKFRDLVGGCYESKSQQTRVANPESSVGPTCPLRLEP